MRKTHPLSLLAGALLDSPNDRHYGYELTHTTGIQSGVLYPILRRLYAQGWLADHWENDSDPGRPARRYYLLTDEGRTALRDYLETAA